MKVITGPETGYLDNRVCMHVSVCVRVCVFVCVCMRRALVSGLRPHSCDPHMQRKKKNKMIIVHFEEEKMVLEVF